MAQEDVCIRFEWIMRYKLRDESNFWILEGFISVLLGEDVKIVELIEDESNQESDTYKFDRIDIKAKNSMGHLIIIEVQLTTKLQYYEKLYRGMCPVISKYHYDNQQFDGVKKVYSINVLYCDYGRGDDYVYLGSTHLKGFHTGAELIVNPGIEGVIIPHLPNEVSPEYYILRIGAYDKIPETPLDEWMTYLKTGKVKVNTRTPGLQEVRAKFQYH